MRRSAAPAARPAPSDRGRWLAALGVAVLLAAGIGFAGGRATGGSGDDGPEPGSVEAIAQDLAQDQARDRATLAGQLSEAAEGAHAQLGQVLRQMAVALPLPGTGTTPRPATAGQAAQWAASATKAAQELAAVPDGTSELTVTRDAFVGAATVLSVAASDYGRSLSASSGGAAAAASAHRETAVRLWQSGAGQLDTLVVEAGLEHVHLFLAPTGDPADVPREFSEPDGS